MDVLLPIVQGLVDKYPVMAMIIFSIGILRVCVKPVVAVLHAIADATPNQGDNAKLAEMEDSKLYKTAMFVLDWFTSIKLPTK